MDNNYLQDHGVLGMKWGVRRYQNKDGTLTNSGKRRRRSDNWHEDYKNAHSSKNVKYMSNTELRKRNERLQMEQQYAKLTSNKGLISSGKKIVTTALAGALTGVATSYATKYARSGMTFVDEMYIKPVASKMEKKVVNGVAGAVIAREINRAVRKR